MQSGFKPLYEGIEYILFWSKFATGEALVYAPSNTVL